MGKARLLHVEDDFDISNMMKIYFSGLDFDVYTAVRGSDALEIIQQALPHLVILDIALPDIDGYEVCRILRTNMRTSHIPVIFLTQKDERSDRLQGLELGADDYITKPFDIEELKLRVQGAIRRSERGSLTDPRSRLPAGQLIEDQLRHIIQQKGWALLDVHINDFEPFKAVYGFIAGEDVLRFTAMLIGEVVDEMGTPSDFIGHAGGDNFVVITTEEKVFGLKSRLNDRFEQEVQTHYNFMDRQQGFVQAPAGNGTMVKAPFMTMSVGVVSSSEHSFTDIHEIAELAAGRRLIEEQLHHMTRETGWAYLHLHIRHFEAYREVYSASESNEVTWFTVKLIREVMSEFQLVDSFIGHAAKDTLVIIVPEKFVQAIRENLKTRFDTGILSHYHYIHREHGYIRTKDREEHPFMKLAIGVISPTHDSFADISKIMELAEHASTLDD